MRARVIEWLNMATMKVNYGVDVYHEGKWRHAHDNGTPIIFPTKDEAKVKAAEMRKRPND